MENDEICFMGETSTTQSSVTLFPSVLEAGQSLEYESDGRQENNEMLGNRYSRIRIKEATIVHKNVQCLCLRSIYPHFVETQSIVVDGMRSTNPRGPCAIL